jgi:dynein light intermediate chain
MIDPLGILLLRVRDDAKMTIAAYQSLYESSVLFGINKQIQAEEGKADLEHRIEDLEKQKQVLLNKVREFVLVKH